MMSEFHFLRPYWLLAILVLIVLLVRLWRYKPQLASWAAVCDAHLLAQLVKTQGGSKRHTALISLFLSGLFVVVSLAGPAWQRLPVPSYQQILPRVFVLDMSSSMQVNDLQPNRLARAKFKLHDAFSSQAGGQSALIAYTGEPFVVSPLTEDANTIDALLSSLTPDVMPIEGNDLSESLTHAAKLITQAGFKQGQILVLTSLSPSSEAIAKAKSLAKDNIETSVMPMLKEQANPQYAKLAQAGHGEVISVSEPNELEQWMHNSQIKMNYKISEQNLIPVWKDEGRWFLIPALVFLLPVFRRGWLQRIDA